MFYFSSATSVKTLILQGTCCIFLHNFCPKDSFYWEHVLLSSTTSVRNTHSTGNVMYFSPQLLSETLILQGTCCIFLHNFCPKHSFYWERVLLSSATSVRNIHCKGNVLFFFSTTSARNTHSTGNVFYFSYNLCQQYFSLQYIFKELLSGFALKIMQVLV